MEIESTATKLKKVAQIFSNNTEAIFQIGGLPYQIWDEILEDAVLGKYAPNPVITRGIIDIIQRLEDKFLAEIILEFVRN